MRYRIEIDNNLNDDEVVIKCNESNKDIRHEIEKLNIIDNSNNSKLKCYDNDKEYYLSTNDILFLETNDNHIDVHTLTNIYSLKNKLYELEESLPNNFIRSSKSSIVNINHIYSIVKNITSYSIIEFKNSHKKVYVSRLYFKELSNKLREGRTL